VLIYDAGMPVVFVHGVPETSHSWDAVRAQLTRTDTIALALPGFACELPDGFDPTKEQYAAWLTHELEQIGEPVDLVGHDWGSLLVQRVVSTRPELIRTWAAGGGPVDAEYTWHDMAKAWQTPAVGEQVMQLMTPETLAAGLADELGPYAAEMGRRVDELMKQCILGLYRSAIDVGREWQPAVDALADRLPALVIWGRDDAYASVEFGRRLATRVGAQLLELPCGHFWPRQEPAAVAAALRTLWELD
jgi:pimeloyl-ACP methyl ester carboxylesterase